MPQGELVRCERARRAGSGGRFASVFVDMDDRDVREAVGVEPFARGGRRGEGAASHDFDGVSLGNPAVQRRGGTGSFRVPKHELTRMGYGHELLVLVFIEAEGLMQVEGLDGVVGGLDGVETRGKRAEVARGLADYVVEIDIDVHRKVRMRVKSPAAMQ